MTRRLVRLAIQLGLITVLALILVFFLDNRYRVLPNSIHSYLPVHHPGVVITDITLHTCSAVALFSSCQLDPEKWHRIEKDVYFGKGFLGKKAYVHVKRKKEEELQAGDKVVVDVKVGRLDPANDGQRKNEEWETRPGGIWLKRSSAPHASDSHKTITAVDILFGADAVEPRPSWEMMEMALLIPGAGKGGLEEAKLSVRHGQPPKVEKPIPRIRKDAKFKIMQVSDLHLSTGFGHCRDPEPAGLNGGKCDADPRTLDFVGKVLDQERPDLVILSGDQVNGESAPDAQSAVFKFAELFIKRKIPYAAIFGNHDDEGNLPRSALMELIQHLPFSLSEPGKESLPGVGNYALEILGQSSQHSALTIYLLDTHSYSPDERHSPGYDWLKKEQIEWFRDTARERKKAHEKYSHVHMDMAFIHIPLPEYRSAENKLVGSRLENPTAPTHNSNFRDALVEEGIKVVSCGHDHVNDYCMLEKNADKDPALWMCYAGGSGFGGYGGYGGYHRRVRVFEIDTNEARITTWKRLEYGDTEKRIDEQIIVDGGNVKGVPS